jgi:hypothetical protein
MSARVPKQRAASDIGSRFRVVARIIVPSRPAWKSDREEWIGINCQAGFLAQADLEAAPAEPHRRWQLFTTASIHHSGRHTCWAPQPLKRPAPLSHTGQAGHPPYGRLSTPPRYGGLFVFG